MIKDFEISNRKYSDYDKNIVRNLYINGQVISGLVTEDNRPEWQNLTLEEMYDRLVEEIEDMKAELLSGKTIDDIGQNKVDNKDFTGVEIANAFASYANITGPSQIEGSLEDYVHFVQTYKNKNGAGFADEIKTVVTNLYDLVAKDTSGQYTEAVLESYLHEIANSSPIERITLTSPDGQEIVVVQAPEEKQYAVEVIKKILSKDDGDKPDDKST